MSHLEAKDSLKGGATITNAGSKKSSRRKVTIQSASVLLRLLVLTILGICLIPLAQAQDSQLPLTFGHSLYETEFLLNYTNFNHGSYGACPKSVLDYQSALRLQQEQQPDVWMREHYRVLLNETRTKVATFMGLGSSSQSAENLVLVESASTAVNSILRSFDWKQDDILLLFSTAFSMVKHTADWLRKLYRIEILYMEIPFPLPEDLGQDVFLQALQATLTNLTDSNSIERVKMIGLDHMVSAPAVKQPIQELAALAKQHMPNCFVLVDGAHALGQIPFKDTPHLLSNVDAYLSNGHKWLYTPKGSAVLWINSIQVTDVFPEPTVIASTNEIISTIPLSERYAYVSARDYTAWLSMGKAIDFREQQLGGEKAIYHYCRNLAIQAKQHLMGVWNSTPLVPDSMEEFMIHVQLPYPINAVERGTALMGYLLTHHNTYIRNLYDAGSGILYARLSAQVYLEMSDFEQLGTHVLEFAKQYERGFREDSGKTEVALK